MGPTGRSPQGCTLPPLGDSTAHSVALPLAGEATWALTWAIRCMRAVLMTMDAATRRQLRMAWQRAKTESAQIYSAFGRIPPETLWCDRWKGQRGSARNLARICAMMPRAPDLQFPRCMGWRFLQPVAALPPAQQGPQEPPRPSLVMTVILAGHKLLPCQHRSYGPAVTAHCIGHIISRSPGSEPIREIFAAYNALVTLSKDTGREMFRLPEFVVPAADGTFLCKPRIHGPLDDHLCVAGILVSYYQCYPEQTNELEAWSRFLDASASALSKAEERSFRTAW
jgi:hypothetical protein